MITVEQLPEAQARAIADSCLTMIDRGGPDLSARTRLTRPQAAVLTGMAVAGFVGIVLAPRTLAVVVATLTTLTYVATLTHRLWLVRSSMRSEALMRIEDHEAFSIRSADLPTYTVLVPAFREPELVVSLVRSLERLDYPRDRLEVKLLLEHDDAATLEAARSIVTRLHVDVLVIPPGSPQTKPRALNFGLQRSTGELITIYDIEDRPEPLQLRRAAVAMRRLPGEVACLQARLEFYGTHRNFLSKLFCVEYLTWFRCFLPGLASTGGVVPLGGTSNHLRRAALDTVGAWDAYNVTEDADLGIRLQRFGYRIGVLDSVTLEEVNSDTINWIKQRSRWQKGYLQTALVHLRHPFAVRRELGTLGLLHLVLFVAGTPLLALCNLAFWSLTVAWGLTHAHVIETIFSGPLYYVSIGVWLIGNFAIAYLSVVTLLDADRSDLLGSLIFTPVYWLLMSVSALRACIQLVVDPFHWEKTTHGFVPDDSPIDLRTFDDVDLRTGLQSVNRY